jgi:hypothetical protein
MTKRTEKATSAALRNLQAMIKISTSAESAPNESRQKTYTRCITPFAPETRATTRDELILVSTGLMNAVKQ